MIKKILFVAYGGGHINIIDLIAKELLREKSIEFKILALTGAYDRVINQYPLDIVKKISDYSFLFDKDIDKVLKYGLELFDSNIPLNGIAKEEMIYYLGLSFFDLVQKVGQKEAYALFKEKGRGAFLPVAIIKKIIEYEKFDTVISTTSPRFEQASLIAANKLNIPSLQILDLFGDLYPLPEAKHIVCINTSVENILKEKGLTNCQYYPFGQPVIENSLKSIKSINKTLAYKKINLSPTIKTLLYASQIPILHNKNCTYISKLNYKKVNDKIFSLLCNIHKKLHINIIFRIHPNEDLNRYKEYFSKYPFVMYINDKLELYESIAVSDYIVTPYSTLAIEAVASEKVVFTYKSDFDNCFPIVEMTKEPFVFANTYEELEKNIYAYLSKEKKNSYRMENFFPKNSVHNIIKLIKEI